MNDHARTAPVVDPRDAGSAAESTVADPIGRGTAGPIDDAAPAPTPPPATPWARLVRYVEPHQGGRFSSLDGFRAIAALGVVVYHVAGYANLTGSPTLTSKFLNNLGNYGVAVFFLLSGFLLYRPFVMAWFTDKPSPDPIVYLRHRFLRIFPAYWLALGAFLALGLLKAQNPGPDYFFTLFSLTQVYRKAYGFAGISVAWTLCIEVAFYLALPLIAALIRLIGRSARTLKMKLEAQLVGLVVMVIVSLGYRLLVAGPYQYDNKAHPFAVEHLWLFNYLDWFALGMLLAVCVCWTDMGRSLPTIVQRFANTGWLCWIFAAACYLALMMVRENTAASGAGVGRETPTQMAVRFLLNGVAAFFFLVPGVLGRREHSLINRGLSSLVPMFLGTISYGLYLWHKIWLDYLKEGRPPSARYGFWTMLALVVAMSIVSASLSYYLLERPIMRFRDPKRLRMRRRAAARTG